MSAASMKKWREKNPMKQAYNALKYNAVRRGIPFELTFEQFKKFCFKTKLLTKRGRDAESYTVDRINNEVGYVPGNIQMLTKSDNSYKGYLEREIYWMEGEGLRSRVHKPDLTEYPF